MEIIRIIIMIIMLMRGVRCAIGLYPLRRPIRTKGSILEYSVSTSNFLHFCQQKLNCLA